MTNVLAKSAAILAIAIFATAASAQICPPTPSGFDGLTGNTLNGIPNNGAILDFFTANNSSDAVNMDNTAEAYQSEPIAIQFADARVPAGVPLSLCFSVGIKPAPITAPQVDGDIWLDVNNGANFFTLVDGIGLTKLVPDFLGVTPGPNNLFTIFAAVTADPGALGACVTFQTILLDPLAPAPFFVSFSNPIAFGVAPGFRSVSPNIQSPGGLVTLDVPGAANGDVIQFNPALATTMNASKQAAVPAGALSGQVSGLISVFQTLGSVDGINDFVAVTNPNPMPQAGGALNFVTNSNLPIAGQARASALGVLGSGTSFDTFTAFLNAGDIIDIELYSTDFVGQQILDGFGNLINPFAQEGFDPFVTLQVASNPDTLAFDPAPNFGLNLTPPFNLHQDDNSGPENNARLTWQAKWTGTYNVIVGCANPAGFASGTYLINAIVTPGAPCAQAFYPVGLAPTNANRRNVVPQGGQIDIVCANVFIGNSYTIDLIPKAGAPFLTRSVSNVVATQPNRLTLAVPAATAGSLPMGLHQIRIRDDSTGLQGMVWDNSVFTPFTGVLSDLLCIRGSNIIQASAAAGTGTPIGIAMQNTTTIYFPSINNVPTSFLATPYVNYVVGTDPGGSTVAYCEALGVDENIPDLFDTMDQFSANNNGIFNPQIQSWAYSLLNPGPYNDDDGIVPTSLFPAPMGIGFNAAVIDTLFPLLNPGGGGYQFYVDTFVVHGAYNNTAMIVNCVIQ
ncbi:MAG: hypothetical protein H6807_12195 [Planctomycetes bacterium]|nr:hypothetical protein [Planctomycetota bacterium]